MLVDEYPYFRQCRRCNKLKLLTEFGFNRSDPAEGRNKLCRECNKEAAYTRYHRDPAKAVGRNEKYRKISKKTLALKVKSNYVYQPEKPEGSFRKSCPYCNRQIYVIPDSGIHLCCKCGHTSRINKRLKALYTVGADTFSLEVIPEDTIKDSKEEEGDPMSFSSGVQ